MTALGSAAREHLTQLYTQGVRIGEQFKSATASLNAVPGNLWDLRLPRGANEPQDPRKTGEAEVAASPSGG
jgi:hypothetical protein